MQTYLFTYIQNGEAGALPMTEPTEQDAISRFLDLIGGQEVRYGELVNLYKISAYGSIQGLKAEVVFQGMFRLTPPAQAVWTLVSV